MEIVMVVNHLVVLEELVVTLKESLLRVLMGQEVKTLINLEVVQEEIPEQR